MTSTNPPAAVAAPSASLCAGQRDRETRLQRCTSLFAAVLLIALLTCPAPAQSPDWIPTFGALPGLDDDVTALTVFDDGAGPALYIGGSFDSAGGASASRVAKWDGIRWSPLGSGLESTSSDPVDDLQVFDDGTGPALYVAGSFHTAGGNPASNIARWDGMAWTSLGAGLDSGVNALAVFDDGTGPALYVGGTFAAAGGAPASQIAKWDGAQWSPVGNGLDGGVFALAVFDDGTGPALYAAGGFQTAGGMPANHIAKWDGSVWSPLGSGLSNDAAALIVFDDGAGPALYAGGIFFSAGGTSARSIAKWDGVTWTPLGRGLDYDGLTAPSVAAMAVFHDGAGQSMLYVAGRFLRAGGNTAYNIARWDGVAWVPLGSDLNGGGLSGQLHAMTVFDDGGGSALYVGGQFTSRGDRIVRWDGAGWSALGRGLNNHVFVLELFDDGTGTALYAGGVFRRAGDDVLNGIARWDGTAWSPLENGVDGRVSAFGVFDDGAGPALYAGGTFRRAGGRPANNIAKWDGVSWSPLAGGVDAGIGWPTLVYAMAVFDDGTGPALYVAGELHYADGLPANHIAKWDGVTWSTLSSGVSHEVYALEVFDDGTGPALYAGGKHLLGGRQPGEQHCEVGWRPVVNSWRRRRPSRICPRSLRRRDRAGPLRWRTLRLCRRQPGHQDREVEWRSMVIPWRRHGWLRVRPQGLRPWYRPGAVCRRGLYLRRWHSREEGCQMGWRRVVATR